MDNHDELREQNTENETLTVQTAEPEAPHHSPHMNTPLPKEKRPRSGFVVLLIVAVILIPLICGTLALVGLYNYATLDSGQNTPGIQGVPDDFDFDKVAPAVDDDSLSVQVAAKTLPSVVSIQVVGETQVNPYTGEQSQVSGSGSGVVIDSRGYILTNNHVIAEGTAFTVNTGSQSLDATLIGTDETSDLAVLKVESNDLPAIQVGTSKNLKVGQYVMAVGSPFGLENSVSTGIISGLGRNSTIQGSTSQVAFIDLVQTDAAINPGNSGGALVNSNAELIGINTLIQSTSGSSAGVGFAIPVDSAILVARQLIETGQASHPFLGVATQTINSQIASTYGLPQDSGAYVVRVTENSPADFAGIEIGDIIIKIDGSDIASSEEVFAAVRRAQVGEEISIVFVRNGNEQTVTATLASDSGERLNPQNQQQQNYHQNQ